MQLVLFPKTSNLAVGIGIGIAIVAAGRWLTLAALDPDSESIYAIIGILTMLGGLWVAVTCLARILKPKPSFEADVEGFSILGKKKQPWANFQGVGVYELKQYGFTTVQHVTIKVGKNPTFARKKQIKWTHLSDKAPVMAREILAFAQERQMKEVMQGLVTKSRAQADAIRAAQNAEPGDTIDPLAPKPKTAPISLGFDDGPIQTPKGWGARLFGS